MPSTKPLLHIHKKAQLTKNILDASGIDVAKVSLKDYKSALDSLREEGKILYTEIVDFEADGESLIISPDPSEME